MPTETSRSSARSVWVARREARQRRHRLRHEIASFRTPAERAELDAILERHTPDQRREVDAVLEREYASRQLSRVGGIG